MQTRLFTACAMLVAAVGLVGVTGCSDDDDVRVPGGGTTGGGGAMGGGADIDVTNSTPSSGDTNISGSGVVVQTSFDTLSGTPVTRVQLDASTDGNLRQVLVYFETANGTPRAVSYSWGVSSAMENVVYCPAAGCAGVTVNMSTQEIFFTNTALDNNDPFGPPSKFATLSLGAIQYPSP